jgi:hypothetical protein
MRIFMRIWVPVVRRGGPLAIALAAAWTRGSAEEKPPPAPRITALTPLAVPPGFSGPVRLRGVRLKEATAVRAEGAIHPVTLEIKERKEAATPSGIEATVAGDSEIVVEIALPADAAAGPLSLVVVMGETAAAPVVLTVCARTTLVTGDPGSGFQNAKMIDPGSSVSGTIGSPREVDVFAVTAVAGRKLRASITARATASLLDPLLTAYDGSGHQLAVRDDTSVTSRDAALEVTPAADGSVYFVVQDALDLGSEWHSYLLEVAAVP